MKLGFFPLFSPFWDVTCHIWGVKIDPGRKWTWQNSIDPGSIHLEQSFNGSFRPCKCVRFFITLGQRQYANEQGYSKLGTFFIVHNLAKNIDSWFFLMIGAWIHLTITVVLKKRKIFINKKYLEKIVYFFSVLPISHFPSTSRPV